MYTVTSGDIKRVYQHESPDKAAWLFLETEDGPFGIITEVTWHSQDSDLLGARFFHTKTLLAEIEEHNERLLTFSEENV